MLARFSHGCQKSDTRKLSSSRAVNLRRKSSYTRCNREAHKWRTHPSCKIIQQQPQRHSHKSNGRAELLVQTIRNQIKAYKIKSEKNIGTTIEADSSLLTWLPRRSMAVQAIPQTTILNDHSVREDSTRAMPKSILLVGEAVACRRPGEPLNTLESARSEGVWFERDSKTDEHLIGTPNGMVRSGALNRRMESRRWDISLPRPWCATHGHQQKSREEDH